MWTWLRSISFFLFEHNPVRLLFLQSSFHATCVDPSFPLFCCEELAWCASEVSVRLIVGAASRETATGKPKESLVREG